ncbi:MAG: hypothetical protein AAFR93_03720 [Pseudomonadota bacterium]
MAAVGKPVWALTLGLGALQLVLALVVLRASTQDPIDRIACLGGIFASVLSVAILAIVAVWALVLLVLAFRNIARLWGLLPLFLLALASAIALSLTTLSMLRCTV